MYFLKKNKALFKFAARERWQQLSLTAVIFIGVLILVFFSQESKGQNMNWWADWVDPIVGTGTFMIALAVWISELSQEWGERLPKRVTVEFHFKNRIVMTCQEAYLSSEGDIRAWGQQLGKQMSGTNFLQFQPYLKQEQPEDLHDENGVFYKLYHVIFYLKDIPIPDAKHLAEKDKKELAKKLDNGCIVWEKADKKGNVKVSYKPNIIA